MQAIQTRLKWLLLLLLFGLSAAGLVTGARQSASRRRTDPSPGSKAEDRLPRKKISVPDKDALICNGTVVSEGGFNLAVIDGQSLPAGTVFKGIKILEVTDGCVRIQSGKKTIRLAPGDRFVPEKK